MQDSATFRKDIIVTSCFEKIGLMQGDGPFISAIQSFEKVCFVGDVIFRESIGRFDLPGGDFDLLEASISNHIYSLPDDTKLMSGHGPETTVSHEIKNNPFVRL